MRPQLLHLSGPRRGRTVTYDDPYLEVGSAPGIDLRLRHGAVAAHHAVVEWHEADCAFHLRATDGRVFVNRTEVREIALEDGDLIEWGLGGPRSRFRVYVPPGRVCKPVRRMLRDARDVRRESGRASAARGLARDLLTQASPRLKVGFPALVLVVALPLAWVAGWLGGRPAAAQSTADEVTLEEIRRLRAEQQSQREALERVEAASAVVTRIERRWSRGVCLVHGRVAGRGPDGREVRGEYTGSGFLVAASGEVLTNRHVLSPWETMPQFEPLLQAGREPVFEHLTATFPGRQPLPVPVDSLRRRGDGVDIGVFRLDPADVRGVPILPLCEHPLENLADRRAIVVGYPTGLKALMAMADPDLVTELRAARAPMTEVIRRLAVADCIRPTMTQGILSNIEPRVVVYDAITTHGGSGGPVFGGEGTVVAVNFAVLRNFTGANYGVPIALAKALLPR